MNVFKRGMIFVTFFGCCFGMALMAAALGTKHWFEADAKQLDANTNFTQFRPEASGHIHFGLFKGVKTLNWGIGDRVNEFSASEDDLLSEALWICTIAFLASGLFFAVLGAIFAVVNTATTPVEALTGVPGLYVWNVLAALFSVASVVCWTVEFYKSMTKNVLKEEFSWTTEGEEHFGYSFWLVVVAAVVHIANCLIIHVGTYEPKVKTQYEAPETKSSNIMLY